MKILFIPKLKKNVHYLENLPDQMPILLKSLNNAAPYSKIRLLRRTSPKEFFGNNNIDNNDYFK